MNLYDIDYNSKAALFQSTNEMFELAEYDHIARKLIYRYCPPEFAHYMINNPDALSYVVECLMFGSCRWNRKRKNTTHRGYLSRCGRWAIIRWALDLKKNRGIGISLYSKNANGELLSNVLEDKKYVQSIGQEQTRKYLIKLINDVALTETQRSCLVRVYINGESQASIAQEMGVSREAVRSLLERAINRIKKHEAV